jgi:hypothetical protein
MGNLGVPVPEISAGHLPADLHAAPEPEAQDAQINHLATYGDGLEDRISSGNNR